MSHIAYLCTDLLFTSKIRETARLLGREVSGARDAASLARAARGAALVLIDLRLSLALDALQALRADPLTAEIPSVGFCEHENLALMARAREAGCTQVLAKGQFSAELKHLLGQ